MASHRTLFLLACAPLFGQQYTISTVAGNGVAGASLYNPTSVAVDSAGDLYVGDWSGFIRKIWMKDGATTIVAGTGNLGYSGDGGLATGARIGKTASIALDSEGNIYFADGDNNRIRRINVLTGIITTVAGTGAAADSGDGGPAVTAGVSRPTGIVMDGAGNLYFSSSWSRVRKLIAKTGMIEPVAGQVTTGFSGDGGAATNAMFWDPVPSAIGPNGDLYLADYENSRIRIVAASTGVVTTFAGSGACPPSVPLFNATVCQGGFGGDGGPARNATLNYAASATLDLDGNLYIADTINRRIRRVDAATGVIHTIAGNGISGFSGDHGPALAAEIASPVSIVVDPSGRIYFADENNQCIRMLTPTVPQVHPLRRDPALPRGR